MASVGRDDNRVPGLLVKGSATGADVVVEGDETEKAANVHVTGSDVSGLLVPYEYDYIGIAYPDTTTETYTYKTGGASGTAVAIVTVVYTNDTKSAISSVART